MSNTMNDPASVLSSVFDTDHALQITDDGAGTTTFKVLPSLEGAIAGASIGARIGGVPGAAIGGIIGGILG